MLLGSTQPVVGCAYSFTAGINHRSGTCGHEIMQPGGGETGNKDMSKTTIVVGLDGSEAGARALDFAKAQARRLDDCAIAICYVIEWSPFSFQTAEENDQRHKRREEEIELARTRILDPAVKDAEGDNFEVVGIVKHGDAADILEDVAGQHSAVQIVVGRVGARGLKERLFGGVTGRLVATASVPVTIVP